MAVRKVNGRYVVEFQSHGKRVFKRLPEFATKSDAAQLEAKLRRERWEYSELGRAEEPTLAEAIIGWLRATEAGRKDKLNPARNAAHLATFVEGKALREVGEVSQEIVARWRTDQSKGGSGRMRSVAKSTMAARTVNASCPKNAAQVGPATQPLSPAGEVAGKVIAQWSDAHSSSARIRAVDAHSLSAATINRRLDVLRAAARWAWKQGMIADNLAGRVPRLREENARQVYLTKDQVKALANGSPNSTCKAAVIIAAYSGLRASEILRLTPEDITTAGVRVGKSKTGKPRLVPIAGPLRSSLSALPLDCSYRLLIKWFHAARKRAGMPHVHFHDLRHSFSAMFLQANNGNLFLLSKILGHTTIQTTMRYSHLITGEAEKAMRKMK